MNQQNPYGQGYPPSGMGGSPHGPEGPGGSGPPGPHHQQPPGPQRRKRRNPALALAGWGVTLTAALVVGGLGIWQVDEQLYTTDAAAENYWDALAAGDGAEALGSFSSLPESDQSSDEDDEDDGSGDQAESRGLPSDPPDARPAMIPAPQALALTAEGETEDAQQPEDREDRLPLGSTDSVLLDGEALSYSAEQIEGLNISEQSSGAGLSFTVEGEEHEAELPMTRAGSTWLFFDDWKVSEDALTTVDLSVPGSEAGGIAQVTVNGEPVNLSEESAELAAFLPSVVDVDVDSEWLSGSAHRVLVDPEGDHEIEIELEASEAAAQSLHDEVEEFLNSCEDQEVLMPTGCPMGVETSNQIRDPDTIEWTMPEPEDLSLTFGSEGWNVIGSSGLSATVEFESLDHYDGDQLEESHDVTFSLDVQVGASGEELIVSVADPDTVAAQEDGDADDASDDE